MFAAVTVILLIGLVPQINSVCCPGYYLAISACWGVGACNLFCCNCDGGCQKRIGDRIYLAPIQMKEHFASFDTDANGFISLDEALSRKKSVPDDQLAMQQFSAIDEDGDRRVSYAEFKKHA